MFDHVTVGVSDLEASRRFYDAALGTGLLYEARESEGFVEWGSFSIAAGRPVTREAHIALQASTHQVVDAFHEAALAAGGTDNGPPGVRAQYGPRYYAAYVLDPDGLNIEAVARPMSEWPIDHVILGVEDVEAARSFYDAVLKPLGRSMLHEFSDAVAWGTNDGALWTVKRPQTQAIHLAIAAVNRAAIDAFWQAGVDAGFTSNGEPGERDYGPGYYAAYLLDPDGNNIEAVTHS